MSKTGTLLKTMQAVLLVTVLTPAIGHADPLSTRQMLAQAQTQSQDQAVNGEVKRINRGLILGTAQAATNPNVQRPVEIPQVNAPVTTAPAPAIAAVEAPQVEIPALPPRKDDMPVTPTTNTTFTTAATPATAPSTIATSSVVTLPAPQPTTDTASTVTSTPPATTDVATTPAPVTPVAPATTPAVTTVTTTPTTVDTAKTNTAKTDTAKTDTTTAKPTSTKTAQASHPHHASDDSINVGGVKLHAGNLNGQINKIMNRSDVKSILSQYGLN